MRLASLVVLIFILCWLPLSSCQIVKAVGKICGSVEMDPTFFTLAFANSLFNPLIYFLHARKKLKKCFVRVGNTNDGNSTTFQLRQHRSTTLLSTTLVAMAPTTVN